MLQKFFAKKKCYKNILTVTDLYRQYKGGFTYLAITIEPLGVDRADKLYNRSIDVPHATV